MTNSERVLDDGLRQMTSFGRNFVRRFICILGGTDGGGLGRGDKGEVGKLSEVVSLGNSQM